jgi:hypothetical protein
MPTWLDILLVGGLGYVIYLVQIVTPAIIQKKLDSVVARADLVHKIQFETEFKFYTDIWSKAVDNHKAFIQAFPHPDFAVKTLEKFDLFIKSHEKFLYYLECSRPFMSEDIFSKMKVFEELMIDAKIRGMDNELVEAIKANRKAVDAALKEVSESIKQRLQTLQVV